MNWGKLDSKMHRIGFFNPKLGALQIGVSVIKGALQLQFGRPLDPTNTSRPQLGEKRYDYGDDSNPDPMKSAHHHTISMTALECCQLNSAFDELLNDTFTNPQSRSERDQKKLVCLRTDKILGFEHADNHGKGSIKVTLYSMTTKAALVYVFGVMNGELAAFRGMVSNAAENLLFLCAIGRGIVGAIKAAEYENTNGDGEYQQRPSRPYNNGGSRNYPDRRPPTPPRLPESHPSVRTFDSGGDNPFADAPPSTVPAQPAPAAPNPFDNAPTTGAAGPNPFDDDVSPPVQASGTSDVPPWEEDANPTALSAPATGASDPVWW